MAQDRRKVQTFKGDYSYREEVFDRVTSKSGGGIIGPPGPHMGSDGPDGTSQKRQL